MFVTCYVHLAYSAAQDRIVMFGGVGYPDETRLNDETWLYGYSANTWTRLTPTGGPGLRGWYAMAYSPTADAMVLFGGGVDRGHFTDEAWLYKLPVSR